MSDYLIELGAVAVTLENAGPDAFYEAAYPQNPSWSRLSVTGLFPEQSDRRLVANAVRSSFGSQLQYEVSELVDQDWERVWLSDFEPTQVGKDLWVCPSWLTPPVADAVNLTIDPGLAFGTGTHPTTAMCLHWLDHYRPQNKLVVDYGCGSGILAVAALRLGASRAWGVDIDPRAVSASTRNASRNGVADRFSACQAVALPKSLSADLVIANILSKVLIDLRSTLTDLVGRRGILLLTGVLHDQTPEVRAAFAPDFRFEQIRHDEWSMLVGNRR